MPAKPIGEFTPREIARAKARILKNMRRRVWSKDPSWEARFTSLELAYKRELERHAKDGPRLSAS